LSVRLYIDFDNTISIGDVGDELIRTFGSFEPLHTQLMNGAFTVAEYYRRAVATFRADATPESIRLWTLNVEIDPSFVMLAAWCRSSDITITVVSDGFDLYIEPLLQRIGLGALPVYCNRLLKTDEGWMLQFPGASESCSCFCASCKRNVLLRSAADDDVIIYIGDGMSDTCAAEHADVVIAKGTLAAFCTANGIPHHHFRTLADAVYVLRSAAQKNGFRQRRQAQLARKRAFERE
jgi:2-hydroxy-3-keto-5-methylthiopentenyl-1-phosphate phosphatase